MSDVLLITRFLLVILEHAQTVWTRPSPQQKEWPGGEATSYCKARKAMEAFERAVSRALQRVNPAVTLKPEQFAAMRAVYDGKDVFVWLPTGFGKSISVA